jgi:polyhydroxyalkanoate synthesis repressor PhaR
MPSPRRTAAAAAQDAQDAETGAPLRTLKKYPNRRLYDTRSSSYITLADVKQMVLSGETFEVRDAKSGEDLTRSILLQIILEEEAGGVPMFTAQTLSQIIRFYGHAMQGVMGTMLEKNMAAFAELQAQFLNPVNAAKGLYDPKHLSPEVWTQFMTGQAPALQNIMDSYLEQSRSVFEKMQSAGSIFPGMAGFPGKK